MQVLIDLTTASSFIVSIESQFEPQRLRAEIKVSDWPKQLQKSLIRAISDGLQDKWIIWNAPDNSKYSEL